MYLTCKHKDLSLKPKTHIKLLEMVTYIGIQVAGKQRQEAPCGLLASQPRLTAENQGETDPPTQEVDGILEVAPWSIHATPLKKSKQQAGYGGTCI